MNVLRLSLSLTFLPLLLVGCTTPARRPAAYTPGQSLAFLGLHDAQGQPVRTAAVDSDAIEADLRARAPEVRWVDKAALDQPLRQALAAGWTPPDLWISGTLDTNATTRIEWAWHQARRPDHTIFYQVSYPSGLTTTNAVDSLIEGFSLRPPPPPPKTEPKEEPAADDPTAGPRVLGVKDGVVRARSADLKPGRYYARGPQEVFENPITGEKTVISHGAVLGLVEFETVSGRTASGRLLEGEAPEGARLEPVE